MGSQNDNLKSDIDADLLKQVLDTLDNQSSINIQTNYWLEKMMKSNGMNYSTYRVIRMLRHYPDGIEPSIIADKLSLQRQTVTYMADELQKKGLVERVPHPVDRRRIYIKLLPAGKKIADKLVTEMDELQVSVFSKFTREEMEQYLETRMKIIKYTEEEIEKNYTDKN